MAETFPASSVRLPTFCIIGAMRSGTTALARNLGSHPDIFVARVKEVRYFNRYYERGIEWYAGQFRRAGAQHAIGEATPYMHDPVAVERMATDLPNLMLIAILRNPVDRAYSQYWLRRALGQETLPFPEAISSELAQAPGGGRYLGWGRYVDQLEQVCMHYARSSVHVIIFEELVERPREIYSAACRFLGVDDSVVPRDLGTPMNRHVTFRSITVRRIARRLPRGLGSVVGRVNTTPATYPPMDVPMRAELIGYFEPANKQLSDWLQRDLSAWRR